MTEATESAAATAVSAPRRRRWRRLARVGGALAVVALLLAGWFGWVRVAHPFTTATLDGHLAAARSTAVYDRDGELLRVSVGANDALLFPVRLAAIDPKLVQATVAVEDSRFYLHPGADPLAILRATIGNIYHGRVTSGASTLTMQLVRQVDKPPRTLRWKAVEAAQAVWLERELSKDEVLEYYLNIAPYGGNMLGVEAACRRYLGKPAAALTLAEAALIAGLPQSPSRLQPDRFPERAKVRRDTVLRRMLAQGYIDEAACAAALAEPVRVQSLDLPFAAPHFAEYVSRERPDHWALQTTLDARVQTLAEGTLREQALPNAGAAIVVIENRSMAVRAMVGSPDYFREVDAGQVNGATARRSPGSTLKPFIYATALDAGLITPQRALYDVPLAVAGYVPGNYDGTCLGPVPAATALSRSLNIPAVGLQQALGTARTLDTLRRAGLATLDREPGHYGLSLALGGGEVTLLDLASAYAALANGGLWQPPRLLADDPLPAGTTHRVVSPAAAYLVLEMLSDTDRLGEQILWRPADYQVRMAWKTGTSNGHRDAWTVACTPDWTVAVWLGDPRGAPDRDLVGQLAAAPIAARLLDTLAGDDSDWFERPASLQRRQVCALSGQLPGDGCTARVADWAITGISSDRVCDVHARCERCLPEPGQHWPPAVAAWYREQGRDAELAVTHRPDCPLGGGVAAAPTIVSPAPGRSYSPVGDGRLALQAHGHGTVLYWFADGTFLGAVPPGQSLDWPLAAGPHHFSCVDQSGQATGVTIRVE